MCCLTPFNHHHYFPVGKCRQSERCENAAKAIKKFIMKFGEIWGGDTIKIEEDEE
jgi:hypothetical protein